MLGVIHGSWNSCWPCKNNWKRERGFQWDNCQANVNLDNNYEGSALCGFFLVDGQCGTDCYRPLFQPLFYLPIGRCILLQLRASRPRDGFVAEDHLFRWEPLFGWKDLDRQTPPQKPVDHRNEDNSCVRLIHARLSTLMWIWKGEQSANIRFRYGKARLKWCV